MNAFEFVTLRSWDAAAAALASAKPGTAVAKAGGVDLVDRLKEGTVAPQTVINIRQIAQKSAQIRAEAPDKTPQPAGSFELGALVTLADLAASREVRERMPALAQAAGEAASPQIRNVATLGGNLCQKPRCWYFRSHDSHCLKKGGDTCFAVGGDNRYHAVLGAGACHIVHPSNTATALLAHSCVLRLVGSSNGKPAERELSLDEFFRVPADPTEDENHLAPGELIASIRVNDSSLGPRSAYVDVREKQAFDWPLVSCAVNLNNKDEPRVVLGAVAPIPWRVTKATGLLKGKPLDDATIAAVQQASLEGAKAMSNNAYKLKLIPVVVERALRAAAAAS